MVLAPVLTVVKALASAKNARTAISAVYVKSANVPHVLINHPVNVPVLSVNAERAVYPVVVKIVTAVKVKS